MREITSKIVFISLSKFLRSLERDQQKSILSLPAPGTEGAVKPVRVEAENTTLDDKADPVQHGRRR